MFKLCILAALVAVAAAAPGAVLSPAVTTYGASLPVAYSSSVYPAQPFAYSAGYPSLAYKSAYVAPTAYVAPAAYSSPYAYSYLH